ncbi:MAG: phytanoyl-CoA dioxygenase family protein [Pseudomonadales bacterium]
MPDSPLRVVTPRQVGEFARSGFLRIPRLVSDAAIARLRAAYDELIENGAPGSARDSWLGGLTRQIVGPEHSHPVFADNEALQIGQSVARALRGWDEPAFFYSQLLYKPPGHTHATPWHQDDAYSKLPFLPAGTPLRHLSLQFWLALDDTDEASGCMHFHPAPDSNELLPHRVVAGDPEDDARLLGLVDETRHINPDMVSACPLQTGGATVHDSGTLHYTPPNRSNRRRRAYIFNFADPALLARLRSG